MSLKKLIFKSITKLAIVFVICLIGSLLINAFAPIISNNLAIGQLENSDTNWALMQAWNSFQNVINLLGGAICLYCGYFIGVDIYNYFKTKGEN